MYIYLFITGLIFTGVGLYALIDPVSALAVPVGLHMEGVSSFNQLRASGGAVPLLVGLFMLGSVRREAWAIPALWAVALILGGLILGRAFSILIDGLPGSTNLTMMALEAFGFIQAAYWLKQQSVPLEDI